MDKLRRSSMYGFGIMTDVRSRAEFCLGPGFGVLPRWMQVSVHRRMLPNKASLAGQLSNPHIVYTTDADEPAHPPYVVLGD